MGLSCSYIPRNKQGEELKGFQAYRRELGYKMGARVFTQVLSPSFQNDYKGKLELDSQGVPTYQSAVRIPHIKNIIGNTRLQTVDQKKFPYVDNSRENYQRLVRTAHSYNQSSDNKEELVAVVTPSDDGKQLRVEIRERNEVNVGEYQNQYSTQLLNERIVELLGDLGVDIGLLEANELTDGFVDFSKAGNIADGFAGLINIANGMQGELSLSEEFSHLLIGMFRNTPLIQRSLSQLENNDALVREILGDEYQQNRDYFEQNPSHDVMGNEMSVEESLAEEALGRLLQNKLKAVTSTASSSEESKPLHSLVQRFINWIKNVFRGRNADDLQKAKNDADAIMGELAKGVLTGTQKLSRDELVKNQRNARFNHLRNSTDKVLQLLKNANEIERKRSKITSSDNVSDIKKRITKLESLLTDKGKMEGLLTYARWALSDLQDAMDKLDITGSIDESDFAGLRHIKSVLDSYSGFISEFHEALDEIEDPVMEIAGEEVNFRELWREINDVYESCDTAFKRQAFAAFSDFLAPVYEKSPVRNEDGSIKSLDEVLAGEDFDISEFDRWLTSMGESSSVLLQLFDKVVKNAKDKTRLRTIHNVRDIWKLRENAEKRGITDFEWMYEKDDDGHKTGNYISPYNHGQFEKDKEELEKRLKEKYGSHPVGEDFRKAFNERKAWYESHADKDMFGNSYPGKMYKNPAYSKLSAAQRETLDEILAYKDKLELELPANRRNRVRAIQRRRSGTQRLIDSAANPSNAFQAIKEDLKSAFKRSEDDDIMYGERTRGLTDFTGQEYLTLPILYTGKLKNPDTLSTDIFSDLMAYSYMTNTYSEMSKIYDPLEIGVTVTAQKEFVKNAGSKTKEEVLNVLGRVTHKSIKAGSNTSFAKKLRDYLECQVYGRYMKEDDVLGVNAQKTMNVFQRLTSMAYLGCNYLAGMANIATAAGMQNIEAAAGEFFGAKELAKADAEYARLIPEFVAELASREKQSKLALFDELFDVRQNAKDKMHNTQMKSIFRRFFGNNWMFIQQGLGDHWIYNRTAIAMAKKRKVKVNGREMSVWDALEIATDEHGYKYMKIKDGAKNLDGSDFEAGMFAREIAHINHTIAGIYNDDDQNAANRVMIGRLAQQMRKWIIPQMMRRFQSKRTIVDIGKEEEGYYRTFGRTVWNDVNVKDDAFYVTAYKLVKDLAISPYTIVTQWDKLNDSDKANLRRAITEIAQTYALWLIVGLLGSGIKDPDRSWAMKFAEYMMHREVHELGFLTPGPMMLTEGYKTVTSPFVAASAANKLAQAMMTTMWPGNWFPDDSELIQSGRYKGHSHIYKRWAELPLPPLTQIRQIDKFLDDLDTGTKFYSKDYR